MSAPARRDRSRRRSTRTPWRFLIVQAGLLDIVVVVGAFATWPIYRSASFVLLVAGALVAAHVVAWLGLRLRLSGWWVALAAIGAYLVLGLPLAAPAMLGSFGELGRAFIGILTAPATGWKDLLTLELPLGTYQTTLAPALLVFVAAPVIALSLAWRAPRMWVLAVPAALIPTAFGVAFGSTELAPSLDLGPLSLSRESLIGAAAVLSALGVIVWRTLHERRRAVAAAVAATGVRTTGRSPARVVSRVSVAVGMALVALLAGCVAAPWALAGHSRDVLRADVDPRLEIAAALSPLAQYRSAFADEAVDDILFTVEAPQAIDRVRIATLPFYDGRVARVIDPAARADDPRTAFIRVPASLAVAPGLVEGEARIGIETYAGIWVPTVGEVSDIAFDGGDAASLTDGFFYSSETSAAVDLADPGLGAGVRYRQGAAYDPDPAAVASLSAARPGGSIDESLVPESLIEWVDAQAAPPGGAGLVQLVDTLRARGFLSHALTVAADQPPAWAADLGEYTFQPSRAGHSTDRIDALFTALLTRQNDVGGEDDAALVAGVGDDEQFAVAAMMIADHLGFDSRIVVGTRLRSDDPTLTTCETGVCTSGDLAAWIEVRGTGSTWVPLDVSPQYSQFPSADVEQRQDPKIPTDVRDENAETVLPSESNPSDGGEPREDDDAETSDIAGLITALRIGGISLLALVLLIGPFVLIVVVKALRRRGRRRSPDVVDRFTGGWQEYVDAAIDHGRPAPRTQTRQELAAQYGGADPAGAAQLATWADRSVFDATPPSDAENDRFWQIVDAERSRFSQELGWWARLRARVSLRSLLRREFAQGRPVRTRGDR